MGGTWGYMEGPWGLLGETLGGYMERPWGYREQPWGGQMVGLWGYTERPWLQGETLGPPGEVGGPWIPASQVSLPRSATPATIKLQLPKRPEVELSPESSQHGEQQEVRKQLLF